MVSSSFFSAASGWKSVPIWRSSPSSRKTVSTGFMAPASSREMSSTAPENGLDRFQRGFDVGRRIARRSLAGLLDQRRAVEAGGVERLQDVVTGCRQEARLAEIGLFREHLRLRQFLVDVGELGSAPRNPLFERLVGALQREVGLDPLGDVGIGRDDAAVGHRVGAQLDRAAAGLQLHLPGRAEGGHAVEDGDLRRPARCRRAAPDAAGSGRARHRPGPSRRAGRTARGTAGSSR